MVAEARKTYHIKTPWIEEEVTIELASYENKRIAITLHALTGEPCCVATVNVPEQPLLDGHAFMKVYNENEGLLEELVRCGIVEAPMGFVRMGFGDVPVCKVLLQE